MEKAKRLGLPGELAAEFAGTMILILFGVGVVAQVVSGGSGGGLGGHDSIAWAWGLGVMFGIYVAGRVTGAHLNPAVTFAFAIFRGFSWRKVLPYTLAQTAGAFVAALIVRWNYNDMLNAIDPGHTTATQTIFSTMPGNGTLPVSLGSDRSDHRHRHPVVPHRCGHRFSWNSAACESRAVCRRIDRGGNRIRLGDQRGVRHQPGARLRATTGVLHHRLRQRLARSVRELVFLGAHRGTPDRRSDRSVPLRQAGWKIPA